jgi:hypothetical protein
MVGNQGGTHDKGGYKLKRNTPSPPPPPVQSEPAPVIQQPTPVETFVAAQQPTFTPPPPTPSYVYYPPASPIQAQASNVGKMQAEAASKEAACITDCTTEKQQTEAALQDAAKAREEAQLYRFEKNRALTNLALANIAIDKAESVIQNAIEAKEKAERDTTAAREAKNKAEGEKEAAIALTRAKTECESVNKVTAKDVAEPNKVTADTAPTNYTAYIDDKFQNMSNYLTQILSSQQPTNISALIESLLSKDVATAKDVAEPNKVTADTAPTNYTAFFDDKFQNMSNYLTQILSSQQPTNISAIIENFLRKELSEKNAQLEKAIEEANRKAATCEGKSENTQAIISENSKTISELRSKIEELRLNISLDTSNEKLNAQLAVIKSKLDLFKTETTKPSIEQNNVANAERLEQLIKNGINCQPPTAEFSDIIRKLLANFSSLNVTCNQPPVQDCPQNDEQNNNWFAFNPWHWAGMAAIALSSLYLFNRKNKFFTRDDKLATGGTLAAERVIDSNAEASGRGTATSSGSYPGAPAAAAAAAASPSVNPASAAAASASSSSTSSSSSSSSLAPQGVETVITDGALAALILFKTHSKLEKELRAELQRIKEQDEKERAELQRIKEQEEREIEALREEHSRIQNGLAASNLRAERIAKIEADRLEQESKEDRQATSGSSVDEAKAKADAEAEHEGDDAEGDVEGDGDKSEAEGDDAEDDGDKSEAEGDDAEGDGDKSEAEGDDNEGDDASGAVAASALAPNPSSFTFGQGITSAASSATLTSGGDGMLTIHGTAPRYVLNNGNISIMPPSELKADTSGNTEGSLTSENYSASIDLDFLKSYRKNLTKEQYESLAKAYFTGSSRVAVTRAIHDFLIKNHIDIGNVNKFNIYNNTPYATDKDGNIITDKHSVSSVEDKDTSATPLPTAKTAKQLISDQNEAAKKEASEKKAAAKTAAKKGAAKIAIAEKAAKKVADEEAAGKEAAEKAAAAEADTTPSDDSPPPSSGSGTDSPPVGSPPVIVTPTDSPGTPPENVSPTGENGKCIPEWMYNE